MQHRRTSTGAAWLVGRGLLLTLLVGLASVGCTRAEQTGATVPPSAQPEQVVEDGPFAARRIEQGSPRIHVQNDFSVMQHVFVDGVRVGTVPTGSTQPFDLTPGEHTIVCADSEDINDNPVSATRVFEEGYEVIYQVYSGSSAPPRRW